MTDRKKPGVAFWATVVVVVVVLLYPISFVPACWISSRVQPSGKAVSLIYRPVLWAWGHLGEDADDCISEWIAVGTTHGYAVINGRIEFMTEP
jgi:hypothetical protein